MRHGQPGGVWLLRLLAAVGRRTAEAPTKNLTSGGDDYGWVEVAHAPWRYECVVIRLSCRILTGVEGSFGCCRVGGG